MKTTHMTPYFVGYFAASEGRPSMADHYPDQDRHDEYERGYCAGLRNHTQRGEGQKGDPERFAILESAHKKGLEAGLSGLEPSAAQVFFGAIVDAAEAELYRLGYSAGRVLYSVKP